MALGMTGVAEAGRGAEWVLLLLIKDVEAEAFETSVVDPEPELPSWNSGRRCSALLSNLGCHG